MLKKIVNFILLVFLLIKLFTSLGFFSTQYFFLKLKTKKELTPILLLILLIICLINWQLWQRRKNPKIELLVAPSQNPGETLFALDSSELEKLKNFYLKLETQQEHSRDVLFNLAKLLELEDQNLAKEKFMQSWELDPNYSLK